VALSSEARKPAKPSSISSKCWGKYARVLTKVTWTRDGVVGVCSTYDPSAKDFGFGKTICLDNGKTYEILAAVHLPKGNEVILYLGDEIE
jgi:hypothetical protein